MSQAVRLPNSDPRVRFPLIDFDLDAGVMRVKATGALLYTEPATPDGRLVVDLADLRGEAVSVRAEPRWVDELFCLIARGRFRGRNQRRRVVHINGVLSDNRGFNLRWQHTNEE